MNILHLLSQAEVTGAETYAATLANDQVRQGHAVTVVSDTFRTPTQATFIAQPISNRRYGQRLRNVLFLRKFIRQNRIDLVHAHSRAASWVSYFARLGTNVPLVATVHGRQHLHASVRSLDIYGDRVITVCEDLKTHLVREVKMDAAKVTVIPNGVDFSAINPRTVPSRMENSANINRVLSLVGRTSGPKGERTGQVIRQALRPLLQTFPDLNVHVVGGAPEKLGPAVLAEIESLNRDFENRIHCPGFITPLPAHLAASGLIVASGRVAIDALWLGKPLLAFGESQYHGLVTSENLAAAVASNFGDVLPTLPVPEPDYARIGRDIHGFFTGRPPLFSARKTVEQRYDIRKVADAVMDVYHSARSKKQRGR
ncbi:MAG: glycosyltransferase [Ferruginibacter sp.]|nr:glycosyltransferase [Cytophagales bacterium]